MHLLDDAALADPAAALAALHRGPAVVFDSRLGCWLVVSDRAVREALMSVHLSARAAPSFFSGLDDRNRARLTDLEDHFDRWMVFSDAERHELPRRAMQPLLTSRAVADVAADIDGLVRAISRTIPVGAPVDVVTTFAYPVAQGLATRLLGIPDAEIEHLLNAAGDLIAFVATAQPDAARGQPALRALHHLQSYVAAGASRNDPFHSACLAGGLDERTSVAAFAQLLTGSVEPVAMAIGAIAYLMSGPELHSRTEDIVEEALRVSTVFRLAPRWSTGPLEIAGTEIPVGQRVLLLLHAANCDPLSYPHPEDFAPGRRLRHLAFGHGAHYCLGAQMTRTALRFVSDELRRRAFVALLGRRRPNFGMSGWEVLEGLFTKL